VLNNPKGHQSRPRQLGCTM